MFYGICRFSVVPLRAEPSDKSELTSQVLFGECYHILEHRDKWLYIRMAEDGYNGWIDAKQHYEVTEEYFHSWAATRHPRCLEMAAVCESEAGQVVITLGATLPFYSQGRCQIGNLKFTYSGKVSPAEECSTSQQVLDMAMLFRQAPYLWGGRTLFGIDCSGFVQQVYGLCGYRLSRDAYQQVEQGSEVHFVTQVQPGDLAFFDNAEGKIVHVGLVLEEGKIVHAHGHVRIDQLDHNGIFNSDRQAYSHKLRLIRRILHDPARAEE